VAMASRSSLNTKKKKRLQNLSPNNMGHLRREWDVDSSYIIKAHIKMKFDGYNPPH